MQFHALTAFLVISSVAGLAVPRDRSVSNTDVEDPIKTTWAGVKTTTVYPGATPPEQSVPNPNPSFIDEDAALRRAGLVLARRGVSTARRRRAQ
ncbi:hypothetical protein INS49_003408 [Diaporthe citri]|uniref:uncharacterized protein n=1 Tax=Diaporthe citri TaxID=83186 RepID=UPI001C7FD2C5|nr:uncharacterized protein INS49_003408 [Diaporthe citri]KAG6355446.1 hypothetical protein INS49_003408 [Diaporthe citri]